MPHCRVHAGFGGRRAGGKCSALPTRHKEIVIKKLSILAGLAALALTASAAAAQGGMRADINRDGSLSRAEVTAQAAQRFARMDTNRDGTVTADERRGMRQARMERRGERRGQRAERMNERLPRLFARVDVNRDGSVTRAELATALARTGGRNDARRDRRLNALFAGADRNADGGVSLAEARTAMTTMREGMGSRADRPRREGRGANRPALTRAQVEARALRMFARFDTDRNGQLSAAELQARRDGRRERRNGRG